MFCSFIGRFLFCVVLTLILLKMPGMQKYKEQRVVLKFLITKGSKPIDCWRQLHEVFGDAAMSQTQVRVWHRRIRGGDMCVDDKGRSGRPRSKRTDELTGRVQELVNEDRRKSVRKIAQKTGVNRMTVHQVLRKDLKMNKVTSKFVPRVLTQEMKDRRVHDCEENLRMFQEDPHFLEKIVTGDESWVSVFEMETKKASMQWKFVDEKRHQKALRSRSTRKTMLTCFFDLNGIVQIHFLPRGETVTAENYCKVLRVLKERIRKKRPLLWE